MCAMVSVEELLNSFEQQIMELPDDIRLRLVQHLPELRKDLIPKELVIEDLSEKIEDLDTRTSRNHEIYNIRLETQEKLQIAKNQLSLITDKVENINVTDDFLKAKINQFDDQIKEQEQEIVELKRQHLRVEQAYNQALETRRNVLGVIEQKVIDLSNSLFQKEALYLIIKYLFEEGIVTHPLYSILKAIHEEGGKVRTIHQLAEVCKVSSKQIEEIFIALREVNLVSFDQNREYDNFHLLVEPEVQ